MQKIFHKIMIVCAMAAGFSSATMAQDVFTDSFVNFDSAIGLSDTAAETDSLLAIAIDAYSLVNTIKNSSEPDEASLYQAVMRANNKAIDVMQQAETGTRAFLQSREMLRTLNSDLAAGAFYYSSIGDQRSVTAFARKYIDVQTLPAFADFKFPRNANSFPMLAYIAASGAYNEHDWPEAIKYFREYFTTDDQVQREKVYMYMCQACLNNKQYELAQTTAEQGLAFYPQNKQLALLGIQACIDGGHAESIDPFLETALTLNPNDDSLLTIKGKLLEDRGKYKEALLLYEDLGARSPGSLNIAKHQALCYYNMGVNQFNRAVNEKTEKEASKARRLARDYFSAAQLKLDEVIGSDPLNVKYLKAAAITALCLEDDARFQQLNSQITALGEDPLSNMVMPGVITYNENNRPNYEDSGTVKGIEVPPYDVYGAQFVEAGLRDFIRKDEFETVDAYTKRVNDRSIASRAEMLKKQAADKYLAQYGKSLIPADLQLMPYDADNQTFLIKTSYGDIALHVPNDNDRARFFKSNFSAVKLHGAQYYIADNGVRIKSIKFVLPDGQTYAYDNSRANTYDVPDIQLDLASIVEASRPKGASQDSSAAASNTVTIGLRSDVDSNIPETKRQQPNTFALIIANEHYRGGIKNVASALHDGEIMAEYFRKTLGIPQQNIFKYSDASLGDMIRGIDHLADVVKAYSGDVDIIFYYAGHGMPDEATRDAYLMPVDGSATSSRSNMRLSELYKALADMKSRSVLALVDACFSGSERGEGTLVSARAVTIKPNDTSATGNMMVLTAASGQQTAWPYKEKNHGMFTYFILKKLQETSGNVTLEDLSKYVKDQVSRTSVAVNGKPQTPSVSLSGSMNTLWKSKKLKP